MSLQRASLNRLDWGKKKPSFSADEPHSKLTDVHGGETFGRAPLKQPNIPTPPGFVPLPVTIYIHHGQGVYFVCGDDANRSAAKVDENEVSCK
jgi:hypothetical protein